MCVCIILSIFQTLSPNLSQSYPLAAPLTLTQLLPPPCVSTSLPTPKPTFLPLYHRLTVAHCLGFVLHFFRVRCLSHCKK